MAAALATTGFGAVEPLAKELDHVHANQERRERAARTHCGLPQRKVVSAQHLVDIWLPERRILELPRIAGAARQAGLLES